MKHKRRANYWNSYHRAHTTERDFRIKTIVSLVMKNPPPAKQGKGRRGRPRIHSVEKMTCVCAIMIFEGLTSRDAQNCVPGWNLPWHEPVPNHSTIARFLETIPILWLERILTETARQCMEAAGVTEGILAADSTGVETDRYETAERPDKTRHEFAPKRIKRYLKWHVTAILGLQIIPSCRITSNRTTDTVVLKTTLNRIAGIKRVFDGWVFDADKGYDSDSNCEALFALSMVPNIKQRKNARSRGKKHRKKASGLFDAVLYKQRGMIEGIFGAEEAEHHQLYCRFRKDVNQRRFGLLKAIGWNLEVLNRLEHTADLGVKVVYA